LRFESLPLTVAVRLFGFAWLFLALLLSAGLGAITARLRMLPSHLRVTCAHLGITRHLIRCMGSMSGAPSPGSFAGVHFGLVSPNIPLISGLELVLVCSSVT
jgi:hypothetical protein